MFAASAATVSQEKAGGDEQHRPKDEKRAGRPQNHIPSYRRLPVVMVNAELGYGDASPPIFLENRTVRNILAGDGRL